MSCSYNNSMYTLDIPDEDIDLSECDGCDFDCWAHEYCIKDKKD